MCLHCAANITSVCVCVCVSLCLRVCQCAGCTNMIDDDDGDEHIASWLRFSPSAKTEAVPALRCDAPAMALPSPAPG